MLLTLFVVHDSSVERHYGKTYQLSGPSLLSPSEISGILSEATDNNIQFLSVPLAHVSEVESSHLPRLYS